MLTLARAEESRAHHSTHDVRIRWAITAKRRATVSASGPYAPASGPRGACSKNPNAGLYLFLNLLLPAKSGIKSMLLEL